MLTARTTTFDRIMGLENGADDYMGKPFEPRELVARIHTVLRRALGSQGQLRPILARSDVVCFDGWELHRDERNLVSPTGLVVALSNAEFRLAHHRFCRRHGACSAATSSWSKRVAAPWTHSSAVSTCWSRACGKNWRMTRMNPP